MFYPDHWAALKESTVTCNALNGDYSFHGEEAQHMEGYPPNPSFFSLFGRTVQETPVFHLSTNEEQTELVATTSSTRMVLPVSCKEGSLNHVYIGSGHGDGVTSKWNETFALSLAIDRALVVHEVGKINSNDLLFRWGKEYDVLYRFKAASNPSNAHVETPAQH